MYGGEGGNDIDGTLHYQKQISYIFCYLFDGCVFQQPAAVSGMPGVPPTYNVVSVIHVGNTGRNLVASSFLHELEEKKVSGQWCVLILDGILQDMIWVDSSIYNVVDQWSYSTAFDMKQIRIYRNSYFMTLLEGVINFTSGEIKWNNDNSFSLLLTVLYT